MKLTSLTGWASGFNWYKLGIYAVLFLSWTAGVYGYATYSCKINHERQKTEVAVKEKAAVVSEVQERLPQVQIREVESARQRAEIDRLQGALDEAIRAHPRDASCDLSDDEFSATNGLLEQTKRKK